MYKGKFSGNQKGRSTADLLRERNAQAFEGPELYQEPISPQRPSADFDEPVPPMFQNRSAAPAELQEPAMPRSERPMPPMNGRPVPPMSGRPVPPMNGRPVPPMNGRPVPPMNGRPVPPMNGRPVPPMNGRPVPPMNGRPVPPMNGRPVPPMNGRPVPPMNGQPVSPMNESSVSVGNGQPAASAAKAPAAASQSAPQAKASAAPSTAKSPRKSSMIFYICYFSFILLFFVCTFFGLNWLKGWLTDYEAAQPGKTAEAYFEAYFTHPNWGALYDNSVSKGTDLEGKQAYVAHMIEKVGNSELTYQETSAGLSGDKKYYVKLGDEKIASFILKGDAEHITDIPNWTLGDIELIFKYDNSYQIRLQEGHKAFVNGMELDDSYTIMKASMVAQDFLPAGTTGIPMWTQQINNLMGKPTVKVVNENGEEMPLIYDPETMTFIEQTKANSISEDQRAAAIGAAEVYGKYMISQANRGDLAKYFDASSEIYNTIRTSEKIVQKAFFKSFDFGEETVDQFTMYSDDLFSAHVHVVMNVTRTDGTVKPYDIDTNFFFAKQDTDRWLAYDMTNETVLKPVGQVRLTFMNGSEQLATGFYDTNATEIDTPLIAVPEGKVFSGWTRETVGDGGQKVLEVMFTPDETGHVVLPAKNTLEPMVLTALFENA